MREEKESRYQELKQVIENSKVELSDVEEFAKDIPNWRDVFLNADEHTKRILVNKLVKKIIITNEQITIQFRIDLEYFQSRITMHKPTIPCIRGSA